MSMLSSETPPPKEILPDPAANEAFEAYFRNLNTYYFDTWQVFKGDAHAKPTTIQKNDQTVADPDENRWLYVKGTGNAFSATNGPGWIVGSKASLKNFKAKPEKGKAPPSEKLWTVKFDKKRCKCEWGSDFEDPDCPVVDGFYVGDDMHPHRAERNYDYQMKWRTTRTLVFESKDESAAPVEVVITTTGAFHVKIDHETREGSSTEQQVFDGNFCALKSVVTIDGHPPFSIDLTSNELKYALPGEFSGTKLTEDDHKKWKAGLTDNPHLDIKAPSFKTKVESGKLDSGMKLLLAFVLSFMLVEDKEGQDCPQYVPAAGTLAATMYKMGHVFPLRGTEFGIATGMLAKGVEWMLKEKCKGYKESLQKRDGMLGTGNFKVSYRSDFPDVAAVKLEGVQRYGY
jgi:hypothetical protein